MELSAPQLATLVAITDLGSFEAAARELRLTPSAVSQRVRALEAAAGRVLVTRGTPCRPTAAGGALVRLGRQTKALHDEARAALGDDGAIELAVAVNADSLATWFRPVLGEAAGWESTALRLHVEDQGHGHELLRRGEVLAAITSEPTPVQGCRVEPLGSMRYLPVASPTLVERFGRRPSDLPVVVFNEKDDLQHQLLRRRGAAVPDVVHRVPATAEFHEAIRLGLGWGLALEPWARPEIAAGGLVRLGRDVVDVPLYLQRWRLDSPRLERLADAVGRAARVGLRRRAQSASGSGIQTPSAAQAVGSKANQQP